MMSGDGIVTIQLVKLSLSFSTLTRQTQGPPTMKGFSAFVNLSEKAAGTSTLCQR